MISDQINSSLSFSTANRNYMVGFNLTAAPINGRDPFTPFSPHASTIGFEQFDCNSWSYENRFKSVPGGVVFNGRDGAGILCVIASDASAGAGSATDLEVYVMDTNRGSNLAVLTSAVTTGTAPRPADLSSSSQSDPTDTTATARVAPRDRPFVRPDCVVGETTCCASRMLPLWG